MDRGWQIGGMGAALPFVDVGGKVARLLVGGFGTCALLEDQQLACWGEGTFGRLGSGDTEDRGDSPADMGNNLPRVALGTGLHAVQVSVGKFHTCAILNDGSLKCWGFNRHGQLGLGDTENRGDAPGEMGDALPVVDLGTNRRAVFVQVGLRHTCAILDDATVKCWGDGSAGSLGLGDTTKRGDEPCEMGDALPTVDLGTSARPIALAGGGDSTCALFHDGRLKCWGANTYGELGHGSTMPSGSALNEMGQNLPFTDLGGPILSVTGEGQEIGRYCALLKTGELKCWGINNWGNLGLGDREARGDSPGEMATALPAVNLGTGRQATQIAIGSDHACAVLDDGTVRCWGDKYGGLLGSADGTSAGGTVSLIGDEPGEMGDNLHVVQLL